MHMLVLAAAFAVDPTVQAIAETALKRALENGKVTGGVVLVGDPNDGRVLAVATAGSRSALDVITPASTMKPLIIAAALDRGATTANATHDCELGEYTIDGRTYRDWKAFSHLSTSDTIVMSSNICTLKIAGLLGERATREALRTFGFTATAPFQDYTLGAVSVAPLEVLNAYAAIANGGRIGEQRVLSAETASTLRRMLARVVTSGTARSIANSEPSIAGKTGTLDQGRGALFAGFSPVDAPRVVAVVYLDGTDLLGGSDAAPVFAHVCQQVLALH